MKMRTILVLAILLACSGRCCWGSSWYTEELPFDRGEEAQAEGCLGCAILNLCSARAVGETTFDLNDDFAISSNLW